jgi:hypothetical protein
MGTFDGGGRSTLKKYFCAPLLDGGEKNATLYLESPDWIVRIFPSVDVDRHTTNKLYVDKQLLAKVTGIGLGLKQGWATARPSDQSPLPKKYTFLNLVSVSISCFKLE